MMRVWVVDDMIPLHRLYDGPYPARIDSEIVRKLVNDHEWDEAEVHALCRTVCDGQYDAAFFRSPGEMLTTLLDGVRPPHAVIFDWEYATDAGDALARKLSVLTHILAKTFAYVQIYTHTDPATIDGHVSDLRGQFTDRLLPTRAKFEVSADQLTGTIAAAWDGTIAGPVADKVRHVVARAVEGTLVDISSIKRDVLFAIADRRPDNLVQVVLSRIRDEIALFEEDVFAGIFAGLGGGAIAPTDEIRKLMSVWYYSFPRDSRVRRGDVIEIDGGLGLVVTPACDLVSFPKKTGRRLTWIRLEPFTETSLRELRETGGMLFGGSGGMGESIVARQGDSGDAIVLLPNMPLRFGRRDVLDDHILLCHEWMSRVFAVSEAAGGPLTYERLTGVTRRCTVAEPFASAIVTKASSFISRPGTPNLPSTERDRLSAIASASRRVAAGQQPGGAPAPAARGGTPPSPASDPSTSASATLGDVTEERKGGLRDDAGIQREGAGAPPAAASAEPPRGDTPVADRESGTAPVAAAAQKATPPPATTGDE